MVAVQNLKTTHTVNTGLINNFQDLSDGVERTNKNLNVILHGVHLVFFNHRYPFNRVSASSFPI